MIGIKGDFTGFSFNGIHSSDLGITRISDGNRYNDNLLPTIQDKTVAATGRDGTYFFNSFFTQKQFNINFAFDGITETQYRRIRQWLGDKKPHDLIFDELPYKVYKAKVTSNATIKTICFDSEKDETSLETNIIHNHMLGENTVISANKNIERLYKGEGNIQFTAYNPFARSQFKIKEDYIGYSNIEEWIEASGIKTKDQLKNFDVYLSESDKLGFNIYNPGDMETDYNVIIPFNSDGEIIEGKIYFEDTSMQLAWKTIKRKVDSDTYLRISSKLNLFEGLDKNKKKTGTVYNDYITGGNFFKLPTTDPSGEILKLAPNNEGDSFSGSEIEYDYLYF